MAKKAASKKTVPAPAQAPVEDVQPEQVMPEGIMDFAEVDALINQQCSVLQNAGVPYYEPYCYPSEELILAFLSRNFRNRHLDQSLVEKYATMMLTNLRDRTGNFMKRTSEWCGSFFSCEVDGVIKGPGLPIMVYFDSEGCMHNSQHCCEAFLLALGRIRESINMAKVNKDHKSIPELTGIDEEFLCNNFKILLVRGFDPLAADFIDGGRSRTPTDIIYRKGLFDNYTFDLGKVKPDNQFKKLSALRNKLSGNTASAGKFVAWRKWSGALPRQTPQGGAKFNIASIDSMLEEFPGLVDSTVQVDMLKKELGKAFTGVKDQIPSWVPVVPYLIAVHYFAKMSDATCVNGEWIESDNGSSMATQFIRAVIQRSTPTPGDVPGMSHYNPTFDKICYGLRFQKDSGNDSLNNRFKALVVLWRMFRYGETYDIDGTLNNAPYVLFGTPTGFDSHAPQKEKAKPETVAAAAAIAAPVKMTPPAVGAKPPMMMAPPVMAKPTLKK